MLNILDGPAESEVKRSITYIRRVLLARRSALLAYWPLAETAGSAADNAEGVAARDGAYSGVSLAATTAPGGSPAPAFDGSASYVNVHSASLGGAFNGAAGTLMLWLRVSGAGVWTDGANRSGVVLLADGNNYIHLRKSSTSNRVQVLYNAAGTVVTHTIAMNPVTWFHLATTWDGAGNALRAWVNGVEQTPATGLGTWNGSGLAATFCAIGAQNTTPAAVWSGNLSHVALWNTTLTHSEIKNLSRAA